MGLLVEDLKKLPRLFLGIALVSLGFVLQKNAGLGMTSWQVFHTGLVNVLGLSIGTIIQMVGIIIIIISMFLKIYPGIATVVNVIFIGFFFDIFNDLNFVPTPDGLLLQFIQFSISVVVVSYGMSMYLSCKIGAGPRDGLMVGLTQATQVSVKYIKPIIEIIILVLGIIMGGLFGIGTIITSLISGSILHLFFKLHNYDSRKEKQRKITDYFKNNTIKISG